MPFEALRSPSDMLSLVGVNRLPSERTSANNSGAMVNSFSMDRKILEI